MTSGPDPGSRIPPAGQAAEAGYRTMSFGLTVMQPPVVAASSTEDSEGAEAAVTAVPGVAPVGVLMR